MKQHICIWLTVATVLIMGTTAGQAAVESQLYRKLTLASPPQDLAVSVNGNWLYSLTDHGTVEVYTPEGRLMGTLAVGKHVDQIVAGPNENILLLKSRSDRNVEIRILDVIRQIDVAGAPFKGPADAPVTITVFSEFQ